MIKAFKSLLPFLAQYKKQYIIGIIFLIIVDAAQIAIPQFLRTAIDLINSGDFAYRQIVILSLWMVGIMALVSVGRFFWRFFINGSSRRIEAQMRERLYEHLQKLSWDFYQKNKIGDLMARSINDLHAVRMSIGMGVVALFDFVFMASAILIIIFVQDAKSALISIIPLPFVTVLILIFGGLVGKKFHAVQESYSKMSDNVQESFAGISVIKSFVKENWFIKKFADSNDDYKKANMELVRLFGFFFPFITFLSGFTVLIMLAIGGVRVINGLMTPGSLVAMFRYLSMLIWPLMGAGFMVNIIQRGAVSLGRINEILNTEPSIREQVAGNSEQVAGGKDQVAGNREQVAGNREQVAGSREQVAGNKDQVTGSKEQGTAIEISNLDFAYNEDKKVLEGINLKIKRGQWLGIMGKTGSGKSTLIKTLMRMIDPPQGSVRVFGNDIHELPLDELRGLFAVAPQDSYLFSDSIANNIMYGLNDENLNPILPSAHIISRDSGLRLCENSSCVNLEKIIDLAALSKDLEIFQDGKDTLVGERGLTLSGGQKQRTAIARAAIMNAEILILDDSFSAVDNETEQKILNALWNERKGRTTIIITHRVSTLKYVDNVLVLESGKMLEYGSPSALASSGGFYSRMAAFQRLESEAGAQNG